MTSPPAFHSSRTAALAAGALLGWLALGCTAANAPWDVSEKNQQRFRRAERECRMLTQDGEGNSGPIPFDECMNRRGFSRMNRIEQLWKS